jgi:hypothetical protein
MAIYQANARTGPRLRIGLVYCQMESHLTIVKDEGKARQRYRDFGSAGFFSLPRAAGGRIDKEEVGMRRLEKRFSAFLRACTLSLLVLLTAGSIISVLPIWEVFWFSSFEAHSHTGYLWDSLKWLPHNLRMAKGSDVLIDQLYDSNKWNMFLATVPIAASLVTWVAVYQSIKPSPRRLAGSPDPVAIPLDPSDPLSCLPRYPR